MKNKIKLQVLVTTMTSFLLAATFASAQDTVAADENASPGGDVSVEDTTSVGTTDENTLDACKDTTDNDGDGFVDCDDQDCGIYAICATSGTQAAPETTADEKPKDSIQIFERGRMCKDGIDNDEDGFADCHDVKCQATNYCKKVMYEYPNKPHKAPGPFFQFGLGVALPNFNWKDTRVDSEYGNNIPFDPDLGGMMSLKAGVLALPWFGLGLNMNAGGTFGTNRADFFSLADLEDEYKYDGYKVFGHIGGFVRFQYPAQRFVAYLDIGGGYSFARYKWRVYDADESWDDISNDWDDDDWNDDSSVEHETKYKQGNHFSLILEPGFDYFFVERKVGAGIRAWLPVYGSSNSGMDNIGIMFNVTFTPTWREPKRLKDEYK